MGGRHFAIIVGLVGLLVGLLAAACEHEGKPAAVVPTRGPAPVLVFAAGGSIYTVDANGSGIRKLIAGDRESAWNTSPAFSPDGSKIAFARGFDVWIASGDGSDSRELAAVAELVTPPGGAASNPSLGAQSVSWFPDGDWIMYVLARIGGSGISDVWVMRADGSMRRQVYEGSSFLRPSWVDNERIAVDEGSRIQVISREGDVQESIGLPPESRFGQTAIPGPDDRWLIGALTDEQPLMYGPLDGMRQIGAGVGPALSPDGRWVAYFWQDTIRIASTESGAERQVADLSALGGRDRHFGEQPQCLPQNLPACSYRLPALSWLAANYDPQALALTPIPTPPAGSISVIGLFSEPRATQPDEVRSLGPKPSLFQSWDGVSTILYDTETGTEVNLGRGSLGAFSPDSAKMVWVERPTALEGGEAWLIDLTTMEKRALGPARLALFVDEDRVGITKPRSNSGEIIDLRTGERREVDSIPRPPAAEGVTTPDGYVLRREYRSESPYPRSEFSLEDSTTGGVLLRFEAYQAVPAGRGALAVATVPVEAGPPDALGYQPGTTNIFLVDVGTGEASFIATSRYSPPNWPLAANSDYVMWTDSYCGQPAGKTRLHERSTGRIIELDATLWGQFTPGGLIVAGAFGGQELIDPKTLDYRAVIPAQGDTSWSPDYRYASIGQFGGHGGLCP